MPASLDHVGVWYRASPLFQDAHFDQTLPAQHMTGRLRLSFGHVGFLSFWWGLVWVVI